MAWSIDVRAALVLPNAPPPSFRLDLGEEPRPASRADGEATGHEASSEDTEA